MIATWPDGRYAGEDSMDNDGITDVPRTVRVTVEVSGDGLVVDFTGTDPQVEGPLNSVLGYSASGVYMTVQAATDPDILPNDGCYRPVEIIAPEGTIVNPRLPRRVHRRERGHVGHPQRRVQRAVEDPASRGRLPAGHVR